MATAETRLQKPEFVNEAFIDFTKAENRAAMEAALKKVAAVFGREYPMYIAGQKVTTTEKMKSTNPSRPSQVMPWKRRTSILLPGNAPPRRNVRVIYSALRKSSGNGNSNWLRWCATKLAKPGRKRMLTSRKPSISWNSTDAKCCDWRNRKN